MNKLLDAFRLRLMILCMGAFFLVLVAVHVFTYFMIRDVISEQIGLNAQSTAMAIAGSITADVDNYKRFTETRDTASPYYRRMQEYLASVKSSGAAIKFIYTERPVDGDTVEFLLDAEPIGSAYYSAPGDTTFMDDASRAVYESKQPAMLPPTVHPEYGTLLGGCAPIFDSEGQVLGLVGVNVDISEMVAYLNRLQFAMLIFYAVMLGAGLLLLSRYSNLLLEPMVKDKLTGAYSKRYYEVLMRKEIQNAVNRGTGLALLMLDLDHFKKINDTYGHAFGDVVLAAVSQTIMKCLRADDYFIRYGGEEFAVIIPNADDERAMQIAERIRASVEKTDIHNDAVNRAVRLTISIGISHMNGESSSDKRLMEMADSALYSAKVTRNTVAKFAEPSAPEPA